MPKKNDFDVIDISMQMLEAQIKETLNARSNMGALVAVSSFDEYRFSFLTYWNKLVHAGMKGLEDWEIDEVVTPLCGAFTKDIMGDAFDVETRYFKKKIGKKKAKAKIAELVKVAVEAGSTRKWSHTEIYSPVFAGAYYLGMKDWAPVLNRYNAERDRSDPKAPLTLPVEPSYLPPAVVTSIDLPTGHLIISDWIRIEAFTKVANADNFLISHADQRIERSLHVLKCHNLIEVYCSSDPSIVVDREDGDITKMRVGHIACDEYSGNPDNPDLDVVGHVTTDYRGVTMIDKADLMSMLKDAGVEDPDAAFNEWREGPWGGPDAEIMLPPGHYELSFVDPRIQKGVRGLEHVCKDQGEGLETVVMLSRKPQEFDSLQTRLVQRHP